MAWARSVWPSAIRPLVAAQPVARFAVLAELEFADQTGDVALDADAGPKQTVDEFGP